ncbi:unnamed protein product [Parascedosporium putredinis]|uniref:Eukaryotic translation initiation factor 3 subunit H n=1 Tax=Parascedosporium putredinis TaxID=1442378 RepID=A0A9P1GX74_9PEZI|nr:unnamed protein product [Parascedosporium putredinis]CAI7989499.1 unnamed protein product [Parascedosporium putredinis]
MADASKEVPFKTVQIEALVLMKISRHCSQSFPTTATGSLVGMDRDGILEVTNSFNFPIFDVPTTDSHQNQNDASSLAAVAPRQKPNITYQADMIRFMKEINIDANNVGWYTSAAMGNFVNLAFIENQYHYQKENERTVALVHDVSRSSQGALSIRAFKLSPNFMAAFKEGKFTTESLQKSKLTFKDIVVEFPVTCDLLLDSIESHYTDLNNFQFYQRQLGREQAKITQWQTKRKAENAARVAAKQQPLPEDEWQRLFKLPQEPSRLEGMLNAKQVEQYAKQVDGFTANASAKMFAVRENLMPK